MSISLHPDSPEGRTLKAPAAVDAGPVAPTGTRIRSRLFTKYVALFVAVVGVALLSNGIFEVFFYYREHKAALIRIQHEQAQVDSPGKERLRVSRLAMDVIDSGLDLSRDPKFTEAVAHKVYYGPVYFRRESEPYMTLSLAGTRKDAGVSIAEVNLK